jgi:hypothetical protein
MSGVTPLVDTLLVTRLAQRADLVPLKAQLEIAGPGATPPVEGVTNDIRLPSRAALQQQLDVGLNGGDRRDAAPLASPGGSVTLSAAARTVSAILDFPAGTAPKILGGEPLWPHSQPLVARLLTATLAHTVATSGLFYESHLQQYAAGTRTLAQLAQEPQARLDGMEKVSMALPGAQVAGPAQGLGEMARVVTAAPGMPPVAGPALSDRVGEPTDTGIDPLVSVRPGAAGNAVPIHGSEAGTAMAAPLTLLPVGQATRLDPANLAASYGRASGHEKEKAPVHDVAEQKPAAKNPGAGALDAVRNNNPVAAAIHPDAIALVRQQLELLAAPVFRWGGEVWPGTPMDWEIHEERDGRQTSAESEVAQRVWTTRLALTLPTLKDVEVRLSLAGATLQVHLSARENATVALLSDGGNELPQRFGALGLQLTGLQIGALAAEQAGKCAQR